MTLYSVPEPPRIVRQPRLRAVSIPQREVAMRERERDIVAALRATMYSAMNVPFMITSGETRLEVVWRDGMSAQHAYSTILEGAA